MENGVSAPSVTAETGSAVLHTYTSLIFWKLPIDLWLWLSIVIILWIVIIVTEKKKKLRPSPGDKGVSFLSER